MSFIFENGIVENWSAASNGTVYLEETFQLKYTQYRKDPLIEEIAESLRVISDISLGKRSHGLRHMRIGRWIKSSYSGGTRC